MAREVREIIAVVQRRESLDIKGLALLLLEQIRTAEGNATKNASEAAEEVAS